MGGRVLQHKRQPALLRGCFAQDEGGIRRATRAYTHTVFYQATEITEHASTYFGHRTKSTRSRHQLKCTFLLVNSSILYSFYLGMFPGRVNFDSRPNPAPGRPILVLCNDRSKPFPSSIQQKRSTLSTKYYDKVLGLDIGRDLDRLRRLASRTRKNSWPSCNSPRGQSIMSHIHARASSGSVWSIQKPVSTLDTSPLASSGSKRLPRSLAYLI